MFSQTNNPNPSMSFSTLTRDASPRPPPAPPSTPVTPTLPRLSPRCPPAPLRRKRNRLSYGSRRHAKKRRLANGDPAHDTAPECPAEHQDAGDVSMEDAWDWESASGPEEEMSPGHSPTPVKRKCDSMSCGGRQRCKKRKLASQDPIRDARRSTPECPAQPGDTGDVLVEDTSDWESASTEEQKTTVGDRLAAFMDSISLRSCLTPMDTGEDYNAAASPSQHAQQRHRQKQRHRQNARISSFLRRRASRRHSSDASLDRVWRWLADQAMEATTAAQRTPSPF